VQKQDADEVQEYEVSAQRIGAYLLYRFAAHSEELVTGT
jgi:hypothetical protein